MKKYLGKLLGKTAINYSNFCSEKSGSERNLKRNEGNDAMKMTVGKKIMGGFIFVILVTAIMSAYTYLKTDDISKDYQNVMNLNIEKIVLSEELATEIAEEAATVRRFNLTKDLAAKDKFEKLKITSDQKITKMEKMFVTEKAQTLIKKIKDNKATYEDFAVKAMAAQVAGDQVQLNSFIVQGAKPYDIAADGTKELVEMIKVFVANEQKKIADEVSSVQNTILTINLLIFAIAIAVSFVISRGISTIAQQLVKAAHQIANGEITSEDVTTTATDEMGQMARAFSQMKDNLRNLIKEVAKSAEYVSASSEELTASANQSALAANQIAGAIDNIAQGTATQMEAIDNTSVVVEQLSASVQQVAANANEVAVLSNKTADAAHNGGGAIENAVKQMHQIEVAVGISAQMVSTLGERSKEIGQIVDTIAGIAGQTNLLALNAAIEAARAGEQGRGFAVVAEEVRKLAEQSQEAAKQIAELIGGIQNDTKQAVLAMDDGTREVQVGSEVVINAGAAFKEIEKNIQLVSKQVQEISAVMQQMAGGSEQIVGAVNDIDETSKKSVSATQNVSAATEEQSASVEEIAAASQALAKLAEDLRMAVSVFKIS